MLKKFKNVTTVIALFSSILLTKHIFAADAVLPHGTKAIKLAEAILSVYTKRTPMNIDSKKKSLIYKTFASGTLEDMYKIVEETLNRNIPPIKDVTPIEEKLRLALLLNDIVLFKEIAEKRDEQSPSSFMDLFIFAAELGNKDVIDYLIEKEMVDISQGPNTGLHATVFINRKETTQYLIKKSKEKNISIDVKDPYGRTPLHLSAFLGNYFLTALFIKNSACLNVENNDKETPLHSAIKAHVLDLVKLLIWSGASIHQKNIRNLTPLETAKAENQFEIAEYLELFADFKKANKNIKNFESFIEKHTTMKNIESFCLSRKLRDIRILSALHGSKKFAKKLYLWRDSRNLIKNPNAEPPESAAIILEQFEDAHDYCAKKLHLENALLHLQKAPYTAFNEAVKSAIANLKNTYWDEVNEEYVRKNSKHFLPQEKKIMVEEEIIEHINKMKQVDDRPDLLEKFTTRLIQQKVFDTLNLDKSKNKIDNFTDLTIFFNE